MAYRLWEEAATAGLPPFDPPEILEADLSPLLLDCALWGVSDPTRLAWLDLPPAAALDLVFGPQVVVTSNKGALGHGGAAAGAIEAIYAIKSVIEQAVPPTLNLDNPSDSCIGVDLVPHVAKKRSVKAVLNNSFGFGGTNASLVMRAI